MQLWMQIFDQAKWHRHRSQASPKDLPSLAAQTDIGDPSACRLLCPALASTQEGCLVKIAENFSPIELRQPYLNWSGLNAKDMPGLGADSVL